MKGRMAQSVGASALYAKGPGFNPGLSQSTFGKKWLFSIQLYVHSLRTVARMTVKWPCRLTLSPDGKERQ